MNLLMLDDRPHVTFEVDGRVVYRGPSLAKLEQMHREGWCDAMCSFCYAEACQWLEQRTPVIIVDQYGEATFGGQRNARHKKCLTCPMNDGCNEEASIAQNYGCLPAAYDILEAKDQRNEDWMCHSDETKICAGLAEVRLVGNGKPILYSRWYHGLPSS